MTTTAWETEIVLRSILLNVKTSESLEEVELYVEYLCSNKDWVANANEHAVKIKESKQFLRKRKQQQQTPGA